MSRKALVVISFGSSYPQAVRAIDNVEDALKKAFPDHDFYRSFTSGMIIRKIEREQGVRILNPAQLMEKLVQDGCEEVLCQPTHIMSGIEYEKMVGMIESFRDRIPDIRIGAPLLTDPEDYEKTARILLEQVPENLSGEEAFVLMGHGSAHSADAAYKRMQEEYLRQGFENVFVATVDGSVRIGSIVGKLKERKITKAYMMPMMIVAGDHARNDMTGPEEDSWKSILEKEGIRTEAIMRGMGEIDEIADMYVAHLKNTIKEKKMRGKLYGIGVGPGDPELITVKAQRLIRECDVVAVPVKKEDEDSVALNIARGTTDIPDEKVMKVLFRMDPDKAVREACRKEAMEKVKKTLDEGKSIAMLALGDIGIYSTYSYVHRMLVEAGYETEMVSGIPAFCAGASKAGISIVEGNDGFAVIPSLAGIEEVEQALDLFQDLVIMKVGNDVKEVWKVLCDRGLQDTSVIISNVGLEGEYVGPVDPDREYGYFTTMVIKHTL